VVEEKMKKEKSFYLLSLCSFLKISLVLVSVMFLGCTTSAKLKKFSSDGCSLFLDKSPINAEDWHECCFEHDKAYWRGGTEEERLAADLAFKECILEKTNDKALAELMHEGVRLGGSPYFPSWYRWGYGWDFGRGYKPLTQKELELVNRKLKEYELETNCTVGDSIR